MSQKRSHSRKTLSPASLSLNGLSSQQRKSVSHSVVYERQTGDIIIKLVNLMSDTLNIQLDYPMMTEKASVSVLTGPNMSLPMGHVTESEWKTASIRDYRMPPHSFTVIRIKSKHARNTSLHVDNLNDGRFSLDLSDNSYTLKPLFQ